MYARKLKSMRFLLAAMSVVIGLLYVYSYYACAMDVSPKDLGEQSVLFEQALKEMNLTAGDFKINLGDMGFYNRDKYQLQMLRAFFDNPWRISPYTRTFTNGYLTNQNSLSNLIVGAQYRIGYGVRLNMQGYDTLSVTQKKVSDEKDKALANALAKLNGDSPDKYLTSSYRELPPAVRDALALFVYTLPEVMDFRNLGVKAQIDRLGYDGEDIYRRLVEWTIDEWDNENTDPAFINGETSMVESLLDSVDWNYLNSGGTLFAYCLETMSNSLTAEGVDAALPAGYVWSAETPYGAIVVGGSGNDVYLGGSLDSPGSLLVIDTGGDDSYTDLGGTTSFAHAMSAILDLFGNDEYKASGSRMPANAAGILGYGIVIDVEGDDSYYNRFIGQGAGTFGLGALWDKSGNDTYNGEGNLQGSGVFGTGILIDNTGDDHYELYVFGQGYGYTMGVGMLLDGAGNDDYIANTTDIKYDAAHSPIINLNFAQGFGFGRRGDMSDGHSWAGGVGILVDGGGDDIHDCGIYALGGGYWGGIGIFSDKSGDDIYMSAHYTLAAPPHYALGIFQDDAGDDVYYGYLRQAIGHGRDFCIGWFEDSAGNDFYQGGNISIGTGNINSIGVFWDKGGDDTYLLYGVGMGQTWTDSIGSLRDYALTVGLFIDGGGRDRYLQIPENIEKPFDGNIDSLIPFEMMGDGKVWHRGDNFNAPYARSVGIDAE